MSETKSKMVRGYVLGLFAAASYGTNPLFAIHLMNAGLDAASVLLVRYMMAIPVLALMLKARGRSFRVERRQALPLVVLGLLVAFSSLTLYQSYTYLGASIASTLMFVYPIMVTVIMALFYHERAGAVTIVAVLIATGGIALLYKGDGGSLNLVGVVLVMLCALSYAIYLVACSRPLLRSMPTITLTFYVILFGTVLFLPWASTSILHVLCRHWYYWLLAVAMAVLPTALSFLATSAAVQDVGSTPVAILGVMEPVTAIIIGVLLFGEPLTPRLLTGMSLILVAVVLVIASHQIVHQLLRVRKLFPSLRGRKKQRP